MFCVFSLNIFFDQNALLYDFIETLHLTTAIEPFTFKQEKINPINIVLKFFPLEACPKGRMRLNTAGTAQAETALISWTKLIVYEKNK